MNVKQSELTDLVKTAECLQIKGLSVSDKVPFEGESTHKKKDCDDRVSANGGNDNHNETANGDDINHNENVNKDHHNENISKNTDVNNTCSLPPKKRRRCNFEDDSETETGTESETETENVISYNTNISSPSRLDEDKYFIFVPNHQVYYTDRKTHPKTYNKDPEIPNIDQIKIVSVEGGKTKEDFENIPNSPDPENYSKSTKRDFNLKKNWINSHIDSTRAETSNLPEVSFILFIKIKCFLWLRGFQHRPF